MSLRSCKRSLSTSTRWTDYTDWTDEKKPWNSKNSMLEPVLPIICRLQVPTTVARTCFATLLLCVAARVSGRETRCVLSRNMTIARPGNPGKVYGTLWNSFQIVIIAYWSWDVVSIKKSLCGTVSEPHRADHVSKPSPRSRRVRDRWLEAVPPVGQRFDNFQSPLSHA